MAGLKKIKEQWIRFLNRLKLAIKKIKEKIKGNKTNASASSSESENKEKYNRNERHKRTRRVSNRYGMRQEETEDEEIDADDDNITEENNYFGTVKYSFRDDYIEIFDAMYDDFGEYVDDFFDEISEDKEGEYTLPTIMDKTMNAMPGDIFRDMNELKDFLIVGESPHKIESKKELDELLSLNINKYLNIIDKLQKLEILIKNIQESMLIKAKEKADPEYIDEALEMSKYMNGVTLRFEAVINLASLIIEQVESYKPIQ